VLRLLGCLDADLGAPVEAKLVVQREGSSDSFPARACALEHRIAPAATRSGLLWRATFALPVEIVSQGEAGFELDAAGRDTLGLPRPVPRILDRQALILGRSPYRPGAQRRLVVPGVRQRVAAFATAVAVTTTSTPAIGLAASDAPPSSLAAHTHGWGGLQPQHSAVESVELQAKAAVKAHVGVVHSSSPAQAKSPKPPSSPPRQLASTPAVGPDGRPCLPGDQQPTLSDPQPGAAASGTGQLPACAPSPRNGPATSHASHHAKRAHGQKAAGTHAKPTAPRASSGHATTSAPTATSAPTTASNSTPAAPPAPAPNGGAPVSGPSGTGATPPTGPATSPPSSAPGAGANGPASGTPGGGLSSLGPAPSSMAPAEPKVQAQPRSAPKSQAEPRRTGHRKPHEGARHASHGGTATGGAPVQLSGISQHPPTALPTTSSPGMLAPHFTGPGSWTGTVETNPQLTGALSNLSNLLTNGNRPPAFLIPIYMEAGRRYHIPWAVLAGINAIETDYGRNLNTSSAGAIGWMQFMPATWKEWGVAVDGHSVPNPYDPRDAIFSAARYLQAAGGSTDITRGVFAYNHAGWYVNEVMSRARAVAAGVRYGHIRFHKHVLSIHIESKDFKHGFATFRGGYLTHYDRLIAAANMVSAANFPYVFAGGHEQPARFEPFDCSGSVSYIVQQAGYTVPTTASGGIPSWHFPAGPGRVTIFYNAGHTFMRIGNRYFGTSGFARPGGGAGWFSTDKLPASYLATFNEVHVPHLHGDSFARLLKLTRKHGLPG
jgi:membrane-bound lytic murein transglycosylase B